MKAYLFLLLLASQMLVAQDIKWHDGSIVLGTGAVMTGKINMAPGQNLILFKQHASGATYESSALGNVGQLGDAATEEPRLEVFPAHKLQSVFLYDEENNINRRYMAIGERGLFTEVVLYETVLHGRIDVLRRPRNVHATDDSKDFDYYCRDANKVVPLRKFYREMYPTIDNASRRQLVAYIKSQDLGRGDDANLIAIIRHYNMMMRSEEAMARY